MTSSSLQGIRDRISAEEVGDLTYELVRIPSVTGEEEAASRFYADYLHGIGVPAQLQYIEPERPNVIGHVRGRGGGANLLLYGHIDTIPWEGCVAPRREDDVVWGRGAVDMKGSLAAMALATKAILDSGVSLQGDLYLAAGAGHEIPWPLHPTLGHGDGAKLLARSIRQGEIKADCCVVGEGPLDSAWVVQGGITPWRITVSGGPGAVHTTTTTLDHNPLLWVADLLHDLYAYSEEVNARGVHPLIGKPPRLEIGLASGGDYFNRNPANAVISGAIRWDPGWSAEWVEQDFRDRLERARQRIAGRYGDDSIRIDLFYRVGKDACDTREHPRTQWLIDRLQVAAQPVLGPLNAPCGLRAATDLEIFCRQGGVPTLAFGPRLQASVLSSGKQPDGAHGDKEGVSVEAVTQVAQVYAGLILEVCGVAP